ncbi:MAG: MATE family efflux transporter [Candidatus Kapabacteria bacterium]|nr:MATE family efflux transporter [Candidatus Kapabacteria bacterium]
MKNKARYLEGSVGKLLLFNTIPMIFGIGAAMSFTFVDTYWVAKIGTNALAAMTFTFPVDFLVMGVAFGLGNGASAEISKAIGKGDNELVKRLTRDSLILALFVVTFFIALFYIFFTPIFTMLGAKPEVMPLIKEFMKYWIPGQFALVIPLIINNATRAIGDTKTPSMIMLAAGIMNVLLDPVLIFGMGGFPAMGIAGASLATLLARMVTLVLSIYIIHKRDKMLAVNIPSWSELSESWKAILKVGLPSTATSIVMPLGISVVIRLVSSYGSSAVAAFGAASRVDIIALSVFMAFSSVIGPFVGQNVGAGNIDRIKQSLRLGHLFAIAWGFFIIVLFLFTARHISMMMRDDLSVINIMVLYLSINSISLAFRGISMINTTALNVLQKPVTSSLLTVSQIFLLFIPLAFFATKILNLGLYGIFWASVISAIIVSIVSFVIVNKTIIGIEMKSIKI